MHRRWTLRSLFAGLLICLSVFGLNTPAQAATYTEQPFHCISSQGSIYGYYTYSYWSPGYVSIGSVHLDAAYTANGTHVNFTYARMSVYDGHGTMIHHEEQSGVFSFFAVAWTPRGLFAPASSPARIYIRGTNTMGAPYSMYAACNYYKAG